jgi:hypothetical protein
MQQASRSGRDGLCCLGSGYLKNLGFLRRILDVVAAVLFAYIESFTTLLPGDLLRAGADDHAIGGVRT